MIENKDDIIRCVFCLNIFCKNDRLVKETGCCPWCGIKLILFVGEE